MKNKILIVKNITREGPGLLEDLLAEKSISFDLVDLDQGEPFPELENYDALIVLGGPDTVNDKNDKVLSELKRVREAISLKMPYLGICLGMQMLVKANGGKVFIAKGKEIGFYSPEGKHFEVSLTESGKEDPLFAGLQDPLKVFHLHGETVELTSEMRLLAKGNFVTNQIVKMNHNAYGIQCHFELTHEMLKEWLSEDPDLLKMDTKKIEDDFMKIKEEYERNGKKLLENFLKIAKLT
ncbi:MAG TPA: type 1 glutamine amidotransferase [Bacteroidales bacterium]|nr:type 1 glutamine amidotransferase [Bacteroidales bacterium]